MKTLIHRLYVHPKFVKAFHWGKLITITGGAQVIVQAIGFICGILIIRLLSIQEYALYTLANSMLGTMTLVADSGISNSLMAHGGKVWNNRERLGAVLSTGMRLKKLLVICGFIIIPILIFMLHGHNASWLMSILISLSLIPAFILSFSGGVYEISLKLNQNIVALQKIQVGSNLGRLALLAATMFFFPFSYLAILAAAITQLWTNFKLRKTSSIYADLNQSPDPVIKEKILSVVKRILPASFYYAFSAQIPVWLISFFGSTTHVAQIGALGRLSMILSLFTLMFNMLLVPRLAKLPNNHAILLKRFLQTQVLILVSLFLLVVLVYMYSSQFLWILGNKYGGLNRELLLNITGSCMGIIAGSSYAFYTTRGWAMKAIVVIVYDLISIAGGILFFNVSTLNGVLIFNIYLASMLWILNVTYCLYKIMAVKT